MSCTLILKINVSSQFLYCYIIAFVKTAILAASVAFSHFYTIILLHLLKAIAPIQLHLYSCILIISIDAGSVGFVAFIRVREIFLSLVRQNVC